MMASTKASAIPKNVFLMTFIDSHTHIILDPYDSDREKVIEEAFTSNVTHIVLSCDNLDEIQKNLTLTKKYKNIFTSVGIHPHEAKLWNKSSKETIIQYLSEEKVIAIGETGLDFYYNLSPKEIQLNVFKEQIKIGKETNFPLIIHCRDAFKETLEILKEEKADYGVFHCYTGDLQTAQEAVKLGFYISWSGILTFKNAQDLKEIEKEIPLEKTLIETDAPFLTPVPYRGKRNEPKYVRFVAEELGRIKNVDVEEVGKITSQNAKNLFKMQ